MNFILNIIMAAVSLTVLAIFGVIILVVALVLHWLDVTSQKEVEQIEQPVPVVAQQPDTMLSEVLRIIKVAHTIDNEDKGWHALRLVNRMVANHADHPDIYKTEMTLRDIIGEKIKKVFEKQPA